MGQKIGDNLRGLSAPVHASVSGRVRVIGDVDTADGRKGTAITITNDGQDTLDETITPHPEWEQATPEEIRGLIRESGIVGMGGAGFPTHAKLQVPPDKKLNLLLVNGAECEPYLTCDHRLFLEATELIILGIKVLMRVAAVEQAYIGAKVTMEGVQDALWPFLEKEKGIDLVLLESKFPQGEERQLIYAVTGKEIPSGGLPWDLGVLVVNVSTVWAVGMLVTSGYPSFQRGVTVSGAVQQPSNYMVRVGTPISALLEAAGGFAGEPGAIILGGPMTGLPQSSTLVPITKQNNGVTVFAKGTVAGGGTTDCIRCGRCVAACPYRLLPLYLAKEAERGDIEQLNKFNLLDCRECACCAYSCPAHIPLLHWMRLGKGQLRAAR